VLDPACPICEGTGKIVDLHDPKCWFRDCPFCASRRIAQTAKHGRMTKSAESPRGLSLGLV
jgi:hypothetical protein